MSDPTPRFEARELRKAYQDGYDRCDCCTSVMSGIRGVEAFILSRIPEVATARVEAAALKRSIEQLKAEEAGMRAGMNRIAALTAHLLANRHRIPARTIVDCLSLAHFNPSPEQRFTVPELFKPLHASDRSNVAEKLSQLSRHGLIRYESGKPNAPGYRFLRIGPDS